MEEQAERHHAATKNLKKSHKEVSPFGREGVDALRCLVLALENLRTERDDWEEQATKARQEAESLASASQQLSVDYQRSSTENKVGGWRSRTRPLPAAPAESLSRFARFAQLHRKKIDKLEDDIRHVEVRLQEKQAELTGVLEAERLRRDTSKAVAIQVEPPTQMGAVQTDFVVPSMMLRTRRGVTTPTLAKRPKVHASGKRELEDVKQSASPCCDLCRSLQKPQHNACRRWELKRHQRRLGMPGEKFRTERKRERC
eukprot:scaffold3719_cov247-Pinguiococcus_pyrenoidosus.AAC.6